MSNSTMVPVSTDQLRAIATYVRIRSPCWRSREVRGDAGSADRRRRGHAGAAWVCAPASQGSEGSELTAEPAKLLDEIEKIASRVQVAPVGGPQRLRNAPLRIVQRREGQRIRCS